MQTNLKLILTAPPDQTRAAQRFGLPVAHVAYRVGGGPHLFRANMPVTLRGGLMVVDNTGFDGRGRPGPCARRFCGSAWPGGLTASCATLRAIRCRCWPAR